LVLVKEACEDVVMTVGEDGGRDGDSVVEEAARRSEATVNLGLDIFDDDALTAFGRFHSVPFTRVHCDCIRRGETGCEKRVVLRCEQKARG
jgi:hypothetical protein